MIGQTAYFGGTWTMNKIEKLTRFLVRVALAGACVMPLATLSLPAQSAPAAKSSGAVYNSRFDFATLYSYFQAHGADTDVGISYNDIRLGEYASGSYYFNRHLGLEAAFESHPDGNNDGLFDVEAGPIVRDNFNHFSLFAHGLIGMGDLAGPNTRSCCNIGYTYHNPWTWGGPSVTAGGGLDINLARAVSLRLVQVDYTYNNVDFGPYAGIRNVYPLGGRAHLPGLQASAGLVWHAGNITPPLPVTYSCSANPATVFPGEPITVTGSALNLNPKRTATYSWTSNGGAVNGSSSTVTVSNKAAGSYTVNGHVTEGSRAGQSADCTASYTVQDFAPPTIACSADPSTVNPGGNSTITASAVSPQNRPLTYSYNATAGSISGVTASTTLSTVGAAAGPITVTCNVVDDTGKQATATTTVSVLAPPPPPPPPAAALPTTSSLCSTSFERDKARPVRVDNEAKACLDDVTMSLQQNPNAKLALVGTEDAKEARRSKGRVAAERAANTKDYLVTDKGIDASRIVLYTGTTDSQTVTTTLVPLGATLDTTGLTPVDESKIKVEGRKPIQ
jgi:outer membrane protein OmpA-like peptidoglycan-associated protein